MHVVLEMGEVEGVWLIMTAFGKGVRFTSILLVTLTFTDLAAELHILSLRVFGWLDID